MGWPHSNKEEQPETVGIGAEKGRNSCWALKQP